MDRIKIPIGRSDFADIRSNGYYYIDKSGLIKELLRTDGRQVTLITRPRRFGKTMGMSMLYHSPGKRKVRRMKFWAWYQRDQDAQIGDRHYVDALKEHRGELLLAGINYDKKTKEQTCTIEKMRKEY